MGWHVYIVRCADQTLYTGIAKNVATRVSQHNAGVGAKYTRARRPVELLYQEQVEDRASALRRECAIKAMKPAAKRELMKEES